jgi:hypothetical protein
VNVVVEVNVVVVVHVVVAVLGLPEFGGHPVSTRTLELHGASIAQIRV